MRYIDADKLALHLSDYALQESPNWGANGYGNQDAYDAINECIKAIDNQPTADVRENVRGKWLDDTFKGHGRIGCSNCWKIYHDEISVVVGVSQNGQDEYSEIKKDERII